MSGVVVLLYNLDNAKGRRIEKLCKGIAMKPVTVSAEDYYKPIESILESIKNSEHEIEAVRADAEIKNSQKSGLSDINESCHSESFADEMLVLCGFNSSLLDIFLREYKKKHIEPVSLKAVLTEHNRSWTSVKLYTELCSERELLSQR